MKLSEAIAALEKDTTASITRPVRAGEHIKVSIVDNLLMVKKVFGDISECHLGGLGINDLRTTDWEIVETCPHAEGTSGWASWQARHGKTVISESVGFRMIPEPRSSDGWEWDKLDDITAPPFRALLSRAIEATDWRIAASVGSLFKNDKTS